MQQAVIEGFRLSPQQEDLWRLQHREVQQGAPVGTEQIRTECEAAQPYRAQCAVMMAGALHKERLHSAIRTVIQQYEILRTTFRHLPGMSFPLQVITDTNLPCDTLWNSECDLSDLEPQAQAAALSTCLREADQPTFDLAQAPLLHTHLITLAPDKHLLQLSLPGLVVDSLGLQNLVIAIAHAYATSTADAEDLLQYVQISEWLNELLNAEEAAAGRAYWRQHDLAELVDLKLPLEKQGSHADFAPAVFTQRIDPATAVQLDHVAQAHDLAVDTLLLSAWSVLIARLTGQAALLMGVACDGRTDEELQAAIGLLARTLPIHCHVTPTTPFAGLLQQVAETMLEASQWQECFAWEHVVGANGHISTNGSSEPPTFFPFCFEWMARGQPLISDDVTFAVDQQVAYNSRFKVKLLCSQQGDELYTEFHYDTHLYTRADMERLANQFHTLLADAANQPATAVDELALLSSAARQQLLVERNATEVEYPTDLRLHHLFEQQVERTPENIALVYEAQQLTYAELNARANQLAHQLRDMGVGPETLVGLCIERSPEMVVGILGVLKAGGAYVPIDPAYPPERVTLMIEDSQAPVLLTQQRLLGHLPETAAQCLCLDTDWGQIAQHSQANPTNLAQPENPAYVIYTSGSTGRPKGAMLPHRSIVNHMFWMDRVFPLDARDAVLQKTPFSFDAAVWEFYAPLMTGARLVLAWPGGHQDPAYLTALLQEQGITILQVVPSLLRALLEEAGFAACTALRRVLCGGEALPVALAARFFQQMPLSNAHLPEQRRSTLELHNVYGPTEATIHSTAWACTPGNTSQTSAASVPIGHPIHNARTYVLDAHLQPVPVGVAGELHVGGANLGRGYLNRPDLTAEKFIPHPFSQEPGARLYKTGDLVRYLSDGSLEFLGRIDHQVKVRGYRIELGEIEATLEQQPAVRQAVVVVRTETAEGEAAGARLVAYVVPRAEEAARDALSAGDLRAFVQNKLPEYMIPATFVVLERLPLTPNGKVDRRALPEPKQEEAYVAPRTPVEEVLAGIWADVLGVVQVGRHDNFFDLGGHSLLATQVLARLRDAFQIEMTVRRLFEASTVAELAERIERELRNAAGMEEPPIVPVRRDQPLPVSFAQQRLWILDQLMPGTPLYNVPLAVRISGELKVDALRQTLQTAVDRHESLRTTFATVDDQPVQLIAARSTDAHLLDEVRSVTIALPVIDLSSYPAAAVEQEIQRRATAEAQQPFDLTTGPLLRATLLRINERDHVLFLTTHHIISDAWSTQLLIREMATLYVNFATGKPASARLPDLPLQYADYAHWQRQWLQGEKLETQLAYWRSQLAGEGPTGRGLPPVLELPTDRPRRAPDGADQSYRGAHRRFALAPALSAGLKELSRREGVSLYMLLMAAYQTLLHRYSGQDDISVGTAIAGRNRIETETIIGFFVNTLVLRTDLAGDPTFRDLLKQVREVALGAYAHQDLPFEQLVEALQPERNLSHTPLFQVMFTLQNAPQSAIELPGLTLRPLPIESGMAKYDLVLTMVEAGDRLTASFEYNTDLFAADRIERMVGHFQTLLEGIVAAPTQPLSALPLLTAAEQRQLLVEWNEPPTQPEPMPLLQPLLEAQVARTPEHVALVFGDQTLTYGELNRRANQVAHHLQTLGVGPETLVGLCVERSPAMIVGLLGILKAGGAYLPLDPTTPQERLAYLLQDSGAAVLLTQERLLNALPAFAGKMICLDRDWEEIATASASNPARCVSPEHLAYVIYTSGSTGLPKGVQIEHGAIAHHCGEMVQFYALTEADRVLQFTAFTFDASLEQIFTTLLTGATLVLPDSPVWTPQEFYQQLLRHRLSVINLPTVYWQQLVQSWTAADGAVDIGALRLAIISGEQMTAEAVRRWQALPTQEVRLLNAYGPTETTITATAYEIPTGDLPSERIPIGRPTPGKRIYILDAYGQPTPIGVPGELCIGGPHLARGYLNRPELTDARFLSFDFGLADDVATQNAKRKTQKLYKTGDLARYRLDGQIEFLGRVDYQVKVRGFRVELGEIEAVLVQHPDVRETVVIAQEDPAGKRLIAYLVAGAGRTPTVEEVRTFLSAKLPDYMIPAGFVWLDTLPLTPNGKLDRKALPAPDGVRPTLGAAYVAPRTPAEEAVAAIWCEVLGLAQVGVYDGFFHLGGHSLLATQVISRIRTTFGVDLPLRRLFEAPTVAGLVEQIETMRWLAEHAPAALGTAKAHEEGEL